MKKYLVALLLALIAIPVSAYQIKSGDTPYKLWGDNWKEEMSAQIGHTDQYNLPVGAEVTLNDMMFGATPTPSSSASRKYVEAPDFYLYSPAVSGDTSIVLNDLEDIYGNTLTMADFGTLGYGRVDPDGQSISESFTFTGISANSDGTFSLTGVKSVLAKYPYTQTSGLTRSHSINAIVRFTNTASFYDDFANKENDEIVDGAWNFYQFPYFNTSTQLPITNGQFATKYYVDTVGAGGFTSVNVSTTRGLSVDGSSPERVGINASSTTGMTFDSSGKLYQAIGTTLQYQNNAIAVNTSTVVSQIATSTPTANKIPIADSRLPWISTPTTNTIPYYTGSVWGNVSSTVTSTYLKSGVSTNSPLTFGAVGETYSQGGHTTTTVYQNTSAQTKLIVVNFQFISTGAQAGSFTAYVSTTSTPTTIVNILSQETSASGQHSIGSVMFLVPPNYYYRILDTGNMAVIRFANGNENAWVEYSL